MVLINVFVILHWKEGRKYRAQKIVGIGISQLGT